jgi:hypothetical protein
MEYQNRPAVEGAWNASKAEMCPKCHSPMEGFDGMDVKERNYQGMICPKCRWFKGSRSMGYGLKRIGPRSDGNYDEKYEGKIRPR